MHAVMVRVKVDPAHEEEARKILREVVVPTAKALPGFTRGDWLRALDSDEGGSVLLFDSEDAARSAVEQIRSEGPPAGAPVTMQSVTAYEVLVQA
jgi:quinol monooxygenase YgiN